MCCVGYWVCRPVDRGAGWRPPAARTPRRRVDVVHGAWGDSRRDCSGATGRPARVGHGLRHGAWGHAGLIVLGRHGCCPGPGPSGRRPPRDQVPHHVRQKRDRLGRGFGRRNAPQRHRDVLPWCVQSAEFQRHGDPPPQASDVVQQRHIRLFRIVSVPRVGGADAVDPRRRNRPGRASPMHAAAAVRHGGRSAGQPHPSPAGGAAASCEVGVAAWIAVAQGALPREGFVHYLFLSHNPGARQAARGVHVDNDQTWDCRNRCLRSLG